MSNALGIWRNKLDYLQQQEAITGDSAQKFALEQQIIEAKSKIAEFKSAADHKFPHPSVCFKADISRIFKYAPAELIGREDELKLLNDTWSPPADSKPPRPRVLTLVALGGEGKTSLVAKWAAELAAQEWPGCDAAFAWSFYSQGTHEQLAASSDLFLKEALTFFGDDADKAFAASPAGAFEKGQRLARLVSQQRSLLILDGIEPLQYAPASTAFPPGQLKDQGIAALLKGLAAASHGLCVVTTRFSLQDLRAFWQTTALEKPLVRLSKDAGVHLLQQLGVRKESGSNVDFEKLVEDVKGHALTLNLLGTYLRDAHGGDIRRRDLVKLEEADAEEQGGHAFRVMDAYVRAFEREKKKGRQLLTILRILGLFDRPMTTDCFDALLSQPVIPGLTYILGNTNEAQRNVMLARLESAKLVTANRDKSGQLLSIDTHPLLHAYFSHQLRLNHPSAWCAAHRRLYAHLCASTPHKPQPTLEDLQPLYQAVAHGCQAGLQQEACDHVYYGRILLEQNYAVDKLGAIGSDLGAVGWFFDQPWSHISPSLNEPAQSWLLSQASFRLHALGRLIEALGPKRTALGIDVRRKNWSEAAASASNLSELELTLGEVTLAAEHAEQSVVYADLSIDAFKKMGTRAYHADALHQGGRQVEAETRFREAEQMEANCHPDYPLLYGLSGFWYSDLLLAAPEHVAWRVMQERGERSGESKELEASRAVSERTAQTLKWRTEGSPLLDTALEHLTLGRAALYSAILSFGGNRGNETQTSQSAVRNLLSAMDQSLFTSAATEIDAAVAGLRRAGTTHHIPRSLLTRAWLRFLTGVRTGPESAQEDLDEAWEIAERGPMRLHMVDILLTRARLFGVAGPMSNETEKYQWESPEKDLAEARKLIETCSYGRRMGELEDAEKALAALNWT